MSVTRTSVWSTGSPRAGRLLPGRPGIHPSRHRRCRSDTRPALRHHFEVDAAHIVVATLAAVAEAGDAKTQEVAQSIERSGMTPRRRTR